MAKDDNLKVDAEDLADGGADEQEEGDAGDEGGEFTQLVTQVSDNLMKMQSVLQSEGVSKDLTDQLGALNDNYKALLKDISDSMSSGGDEEQAGAPGGMLDYNAGKGGKPLPP